METLKVDKETLERAYQTIEKWDFTLTKQKLLEPEYAGWTEERANAAEVGYKRYLAITKALNGFQLVPNGDIDRFWHEHILDTRRYLTDSYELFGGFLHHYPYFGMRGEEDTQKWKDVAKQSEDIWKECFNEPLYSNIVASKVPDLMKCPQSCPGVETNLLLEPMKCPQSCPGVETNLALEPMKCPQSCPGIDSQIDYHYPLISSSQDCFSLVATK